MYSHHRSEIEDHGGCIKIVVDSPLIVNNNFRSDLLDLFIKHFDDYNVINLLDQDEYNLLKNDVKERLESL